MFIPSLFGGFGLLKTPPTIMELDLEQFLISMQDSLGSVRMSLMIYCNYSATSFRRKPESRRSREWIPCQVYPVLDTGHGMTPLRLCSYDLLTEIFPKRRQNHIRFTQRACQC